MKYLPWILLTLIAAAALILWYLSVLHFDP